MLADRNAESVPFVGIAHRRLDAGINQPHCTSADRIAPTVQRAHGDFEPFVLVPHQVLSRHNAVAEGDAAGIEVEVLGGRDGARGEVFFSQGVADKLFKLVDNYLSNDGILDTRFDGYNKRIDDINSQRERLERRLATTEQRYLTQFTALDGLVGKMKSTGQYLEQQLSNLPGAARSKRGR